MQVSVRSIAPFVRTTFRAFLIMTVVAVASFGIAGQRAAAVSECSSSNQLGTGISLSPKTATNPVGTSHTVTAHLTIDDESAIEANVQFQVTAGPNSGQMGTDTTNGSGDATFTYTSNGAAGTDTIIASAQLTPYDTRPTLFCDTASKTWNATPPPPPSTRTVVTATSPSCGQVVISATGVTPGLPHQIVVTPSGGGTPQTANVTADASQKASATFTTGGGTFTAFVRMTSNQVTVSNTEIFTVAACPVATPTPTPAKPAATPTPAPTPTQAPIAVLPSTATGGGDGLPISALAAIAIALAAFAWRQRGSRI